MALEASDASVGATHGRMGRLIRSTRFFVITLAIAVVLIAATVIVALVRFGATGSGA